VSIFLRTAPRILARKNPPAPVKPVCSKVKRVPPSCGSMLSAMTAWLAGQDDPAEAARAIRRFGDLIRATPSLRAYQSDMMDRFVSLATEILAARAGMSADDPEPQIAARALLGLWHVQAESLRRHLDGAPARVHDLVTADVRRAARLIETGLGSFATLGSDL
jgi:hypothetical protein